MQCRARLSGELWRGCGCAVAVITNNDDAYRTAIALHKAGVVVPVVVDVRDVPERFEGDLPRQARDLGISVRTGSAIESVAGYKSIKSITLCSQDNSILAVLAVLVKR